MITMQRYNLLFDFASKIKIIFEKYVKWYTFSNFIGKIVH